MHTRRYRITKHSSFVLFQQSVIKSFLFTFQFFNLSNVSFEFHMNVFDSIDFVSLSGKNELDYSLDWMEMTKDRSCDHGTNL